MNSLKSSHLSQFILPIHTQNHWVIAIFSIKSNLYLFYDPLGISQNYTKYKNLLTRFVEVVLILQLMVLYFGLITCLYKEMVMIVGYIYYKLSKDFVLLRTTSRNVLEMFMFLSIIIKKGIIVQINFALHK